MLHGITKFSKLIVFNIRFLGLIRDIVSFWVTSSYMLFISQKKRRYIKESIFRLSVITGHRTVQRKIHTVDTEYLKYDNFKTRNEFLTYYRR